MKNNKVLYFVFGFIFLIVFLYILNFFSNNSNGEYIENKNTENVLKEQQKKAKVYQRDFDVLDPQLQAMGVAVKSLDEDYFFYKLRIYSKWPLASLTKLITAVVVLENIKNIDQTPIEVGEYIKNIEGVSGNLEVGEIYKASDLLKIMLISSSNRAAYVLQEYFGKDRFLELAKETISKLGMTQTVIFEPSGLDPKNTSTPFDVTLLIKYILENHPEILTWTRIPNFSFQPLNSTRINVVYNNNPLNEKENFLGGKTGTSPNALQNLALVLQLKDTKLSVVIMGSKDRIKDLDTLLKWLEEAYKI